MNPLISPIRSYYNNTVSSSRPLERDKTPLDFQRYDLRVRCQKAVILTAKSVCINYKVTMQDLRAEFVYPSRQISYFKWPMVAVIRSNI